MNGRALGTRQRVPLQFHVSLPLARRADTVIVPGPGKELYMNEPADHSHIPVPGHTCYTCTI